MCDTVGIIREGQLVLVAERDELLARYAQDVIALEIDRGSSASVQAFTEHLLAEPWVASLTREESVVRISVTDPMLSKQALWPLVVEHGVLINRYEWMRPSLEEIFLAISE